MMKYFDYIIVGSGLYGSVMAHQLSKKGNKCLVLEKRSVLGGNIYCENIEGINVHKYGPHIFHTDSKECWNYVCSFVEMNNFIYSPLANYKGSIYNLPFNMNTFHQLWGVKTPEEAYRKIESQKRLLESPRNLEEQAISLVGTDIYKKLIEGYTEKQWGCKARELPAFIIRRLPLRFTYDNNYFNDKYQGVPMGGYNKLIDGLLKGIETRCNINFLENKQYWESMGNKTIYTGRIDEFFNFSLGELEYRSLDFEGNLKHTKNYQGVAAINFTSNDKPYTRIVEHKHFEFGQQEFTYITKEFPAQFTGANEPYYPINNIANNSLYNKYKELLEKQDKYQFGGRLGSYSYYDMDDTILAALTHAKEENERQ